VQQIAGRSIRYRRCGRLNAVEVAKRTLRGSHAETAPASTQKFTPTSSVRSPTGRRRRRRRRRRSEMSFDGQQPSLLVLVVCLPLVARLSAPVVRQRHVVGVLRPAAAGNRSRQTSPPPPASIRRQLVCSWARAGRAAIASTAAADAPPATSTDELPPAPGQNMAWNVERN